MALIFSALCWKNALPFFIPQSCQRKMPVKPMKHSFLLNANRKNPNQLKYYRTSHKAYRLYHRMQTVIVQLQNPSEVSEQIFKTENIPFVL